MGYPDSLVSTLVHIFMYALHKKQRSERLLGYFAETHADIHFDPEIMDHLYALVRISTPNCSFI